MACSPSLPKCGSLWRWNVPKTPASQGSSEAWRRSLNRLAVSWYYDGLGQEVLYRETPEGPEVLAVGFDEIRAFTDGMKPEKMTGLATYQD